MSNKDSHPPRRPRRCFQVLVALIVLLPAASAMAQDGPKIQWELVNPFRFISHRDSVDELRSVYDGLPSNKKTAEELERALQGRYEAEVESNRAKARAKFDCARTESGEERKQCFEPHLGWFAKLARNNYAKTCWDAAELRFRAKGDCQDYIYPKTHKVRVWVAGLKTAGQRVPKEWLVDGQLPLDVSGCDAKYQKEFCAEFDVRDEDITRPRARTLSLRFSDGGLITAPDKLLVRDLLVVGLGDSYASGEGNPDIPAQFTGGGTELDIWFGKKFAPRRDAGTEPAWLDRRCHRSMYSYQFKTALRLALDNPRQAVTYVSYACSGATTDNIIRKGQRPKEGLKLSRVGPQLEALREVLSDRKGGQREIDYLLLSTGGNDISFAKYVAYVILSGKYLKPLTLLVNDTTLGDNPAEFTEKLLTGKGEKKGNYPRLHAALLGGERGIKIKDCRAGEPCPRILLTAYPNIFQDERGETCRGDRQEFDAQFGEDKGDRIKRAERIGQVKRHVYGPLRATQRDPAVTSTLGWTVVTDQTDQAKKYPVHGFCARDDKSTSLTGEKFVLPTLVNNEWQSFDPRNYRSYEARGRWVRLPVDSKLTTDQTNPLSDWAGLLLQRLPLPLKRIRADFLFQDDRSNIMHPTAEAHAVTADANFREILRQEGKAN